MIKYYKLKDNHSDTFKVDFDKQPTFVEWKDGMLTPSKFLDTSFLIDRIEITEDEWIIANIK